MSGGLNTMKKLFCALLSAAAAVALLCGFAPLEQENGSTTRSYETAAGVQTLNISDKCAAVTVESADVDHIIAEYTYSTAYGAVFPGEELYTFTLDGSTLTITKTMDPSSNFSLLQSPKVDRSCSLTVKLPRRAFAGVSVDTTNGDITLSDITANTSVLNAVNGHIILTGGSLDNLTAAAANGRLEANNTAFQNFVGTARNGRVSLANVSALSVTAEAQNGDVKLESVSCPRFDCRSTNSSVVGTLLGRAADFAFDLTAASGRVTVIDDSDASFSIRSSAPVQQNAGAPQSFTAAVSNGNVNLEFLG